MRREPCVCGAEDCPACGRLLGTFCRPVDEDPEPPTPRTLTPRQMDALADGYFANRLRDPKE